MGGSALSTTSVRLPAKEYHSLSQEILDILVRRFPNCSFKIPPSYTNKTSFGDLDIVFCRKNYYCATSTEILMQEFAKALDAVEVVRNSTVTSFGVQEVLGVFQVDLIEVPESKFDFACKYFAYNDLGNLIGRVSKNLGIKFGHLGLQKVFISDYVKGKRNILLTDNFEEALEFLDYDVDKYNQGFCSIKDIFEYVASSKYFCSSAFDFANRTGKDRRRDSKRIIYSNFLSWADKRNLKYETSLSKSEVEALVQERFPEYLPELNSMNAQAQDNERAFKILNFGVIKDILPEGTDDKVIGNRLRAIRSKVGSSHDLVKEYNSLGEDIFKLRISELLAEVNN